MVFQFDNDGFSVKQNGQSQGASCSQWSIPWQKTQHGEWPFCVAPEGSAPVGGGLRRDATSLVPPQLGRSAPVIIKLKDY